MASQARRKLLDDKIPVSVATAPSPEARNRFAGLPCVGRFVRTLAAYDTILLAAAPFIAVTNRDAGYSSNAVGSLKRTIRCGGPPNAAREATDALDLISKEFEKALSPGMTPDARKELAGLMTSAISERLVLRLLNDCGRRSDDITADACVYTSGQGPISPKNIDFVWAVVRHRDAGLYECKNQPNKLLYEYGIHNTPGHEVEWVKSKTWLILQLRGLLTTAGWQVQMACMSLRSRGNHKPHLDVPPGLQIYYLEDLSAFPTSPPEIVG